MASLCPTDHSDLELVTFDRSANAPESLAHDATAWAAECNHLMSAPEVVTLTHAHQVDSSTAALEVDRAAEGPEQCADSGPQLLFSNDPLLPMPEDTGKEISVPKVEEQYSSHALGLSREVWIALCILVIVVAAATGVGFGVTSRELSSHNSSPTASSPPQSPSSTVIFPTTTSLATSEDSILNDSSLAAVILPDGTRNVFFQDTHGKIRQSVYSPSTHSWFFNSSFSLPNVTKARQHTPISAVALLAPNTSVAEVFLVYISVDNSLAMASWVSEEGWFNFTETANVYNLTTAANSRALSFTLVGDSDVEPFLLFKGPQGNVTVLHGHNNPESNQLWTWQNVTVVYHPTPPNLELSASFTAFWVSEVVDAFSYYPAVSAEYQSEYNFLDPTQNILNFEYQNTSFLQEIGNTTFEANTMAIPQEIDLVALCTQSTLTKGYELQGLLWVNGTVPVFMDSDQIKGIPESPFPYTRLATATPVNSTAFYLYHQINSSAFAEDVYDIAVEGWASSIINVPPQ